MEDKVFSTPTHNGVEHIQDRYIFELVECIKELKEHNHKTNILLEKALKLVIANENGFHEQLEQERQAHQLTKQDLAEARQTNKANEATNNTLYARVAQLEDILSNLGSTATTNEGHTAPLTPITAKSGIDTDLASFTAFWSASAVALTSAMLLYLLSLSPSSPAQYKYPSSQPQSPLQVDNFTPPVVSTRLRTSSWSASNFKHYRTLSHAPTMKSADYTPPISPLQISFDSSPMPRPLSPHAEDNPPTEAPVKEEHAPLSPNSKEQAAARIQAIVRGFTARKRFKQIVNMHIRRNNIVKELVNTEKSYVKNLSTVVKVFIIPLREGIQKNEQIVDTRLINTIFNDIEAVLGAHDILLTMMDRRLKKWTPHQKVGDVFLKDYMNNFQSVYSTYINNYSKAFSTLHKQLAENPAFATFVKQGEARKECNMQDLDSFLIMPIQRVPRYKLLLMDLLKNTWETHEDYQDIKLAVEKISELTLVLNEKKREAELREGSISSPHPHSPHPLSPMPVRTLPRLESSISFNSNGRGLTRLESSLSFASNSGSNSPAPDEDIPVSAEEFSEAQIDELLVRMLDSTRGVPTGKHIYHLRVHEQCFPGSTLVEWLSKNMMAGLASSPNQITQNQNHNHHHDHDYYLGVGQMLVNKGALIPIRTDQKIFKDSKTWLFRFKISDKKDPTLNLIKQWGEPYTPRDPLVVSYGLVSMAAEVASHFLGPSKRSINFVKLIESPEFVFFCLQTTELQKVPLTGLTTMQRLAFFVNIYNTLLFHSHALLGAPKTATAFKALGEKYLIYDHKYTLEDIENLIFGGIQYFKKKSSKLQYIITPAPGNINNFLVALALASGTRDSPPITPFTPDNYDEEIKTLAETFLQSRVTIKYTQLASNTPTQQKPQYMLNCEVWLPHCLQNKRANDHIYWRDNNDLMEKVLPLLSESQQQSIKVALEKGRVEIKWKPQNWSPYYVKEQDEGFGGDSPR